MEKTRPRSYYLKFESDWKFLVMKPSFSTPLNCHLIFLWVAVEPSGFSRKEVPPFSTPSPHHIHTPTPSSNLATFHSDWTQDRPKIRTMWVILAWPQQVVKRGKEPVTLTLFFACEKELLKTYLQDFLGGSVAKTLHSQCRRESIPGQGTRSHMPELKIAHAVTNTWRSQISV